MVVSHVFCKWCYSHVLWSGPFVSWWKHGICSECWKIVILHSQFMIYIETSSWAVLSTDNGEKIPEILVEVIKNASVHSLGWNWACEEIRTDFFWDEVIMSVVFCQVLIILVKFNDICKARLMNIFGQESLSFPTTRTPSQNGRLRIYVLLFPPWKHLERNFCL